MDAERNELSPYDYAPHGAGVEAIRKIAAEIDLLEQSMANSGSGDGSPDLHAWQDIEAARTASFRGTRARQVFEPDVVVALIKASSQTGIGYTALK